MFSVTYFADEFWSEFVTGYKRDCAFGKNALAWVVAHGFRFLRQLLEESIGKTKNSRAYLVKTSSWGCFFTDWQVNLVSEYAMFFSPVSEQERTQRAVT